jgi:predicted RNase H-like HicB family nuclease
MKNYTVIAERDGGWWSVRVPDLPGVFTQARRLDQVEPLVRDAIALWLEKPAQSFDVTIEPHVPKVDPIVTEALDLRKQYTQLASTVANSTSTAVVRLYRAGLTTRDIGSMLDISHQRAAQILEKAGAKR